MIDTYLSYTGVDVQYFAQAGMISALFALRLAVRRPVKSSSFQLSDIRHGSALFFPLPPDVLISSVVTDNVERTVRTVTAAAWIYVHLLMWLSGKQPIVGCEFAIFSALMREGRFLAHAALEGETGPFGSEWFCICPHAEASPLLTENRMQFAFVVADAGTLPPIRIEDGCPASMDAWAKQLLGQTEATILDAA